MLFKRTHATDARRRDSRVGLSPERMVRPLRELQWRAGLLSSLSLRTRMRTAADRNGTRPYGYFWSVAAPHLDRRNVCFREMNRLRSGQAALGSAYALVEVAGLKGKRPKPSYRSVTPFR